MIRIERFINWSFLSLFIIIVVSIIFGVIVSSSILSSDRNLDSDVYLIVIEPGHVDSVEFSKYIGKGKLLVRVNVLGGDRKIDFYVADQRGLRIVDPGTVEASYNYTLDVNVSGIYKFVFKNPTWSVNKKFIYLQLIVDHRESFDYQFTKIMLTLLLIVEVIGLVVLIWSTRYVREYLIRLGEKIG
ncbi:MAG: hypothetical protein B6U89_02350 [Desulfurococcales archaeon ex4484_58]|nr:MAG: hypothetical protein B6U89_02350 [Desulfurococcales archaeon ex4484_58]